MRTPFLFEWVITGLFVAYEVDFPEGSFSEYAYPLEVLSEYAEFVEF